MRPPRPDQFAKVLPILSADLDRLTRLRDRLVARGYGPDDPYLASVLRTWHAVDALATLTRRLAAGLPAVEPPPPDSWARQRMKSGLAEDGGPTDR